MSELMDSLAGFRKYHLGCGDILIRDYLNIGYWEHLGESVLYENHAGITGAFMLNHNLVKGIPAPDESLEVVYHSHLIEHFSFQEGIAFIKDCFRVLKPGGFMRVLTPDLELWSRNYVHGNRFFFEEYRRRYLHDDKDLYPTSGSVFMGMLHGHGHKMGYDRNTLVNLLARSGFRKIRRTLMQDSRMPDIRTIEPYCPHRAMESLCFECHKPH